MREIPYHLYLQSIDSDALFDVPSGGTYTASVMFASSDGNIARVTDGSLLVEELF